ncbi:MAG: putative quinol monooxygenase [Clostridia bacterium]
MVYVVSKNFVKPENHEIFLKLAKEMVDLTRLEDGCIQYVLTKTDSNPDILVYCETWESRAQLDAHLQSEHIKRIGPTLAPYRYQPSELLILEDAHK